MFARSETSLMKLSHLVFSGHYISDQNLLKILTKLPALTFFAFEETCLLDEKSRALTAHFFQGLISADVMPKLTRLELIFYAGTIPIDDLVLFLESRRPSLEDDKSSMRLLPLEQGRFGISSPQTCITLMDRLSGLCSGGLVVKLSTTIPVLDKYLWVALHGKFMVSCSPPIFLKKEPSYWDREPDDPQEEEEEDYLNVNYWGSAAMIVTDRVRSVYPCRLEFVRTTTTLGTQPCVVLADTKDRAAMFKEVGSEQLKAVQAARADTIPHWYWLE
ncbi:hypothetical protein BDP27DRAFT_1415350 [Rhodocollybia butyracea]|uniref:Uncharacterized protein n=1 Tax=Rhodocollybia butyracea TaxID=206335 RepID=A0A9P5UDV7_9AGAR|nr:hypothetical protein BDP27DRAFT_1415350 [Rhodocollybia butyracea]